MSHNNKPFTIAIIKAEWHNELTNQLKEDCKKTFEEFTKNTSICVNLLEYSVPGSVELPVIAKVIGQKQKPDAIICIGVVIKGGTDHYTHVANQVSYGCQKVAIETNTPVIFGVLTCENTALAKARVNGEHSKSGKEYAEAALKMVSLIRNIT